MQKIIALSLILLAFQPFSAQAGPKFNDLWWWHSHWVDQDFIPYYDNGTDPHNSQWDESTWTPADWIAANNGDAEGLINQWTNASILQARYVDDGVPYMNVGENFYHLSGYDKRRVMATVDYVYQVTAQQPGMFYLKDAETRRVIGYYSKEGLTLQ